jgi:hypothetical protein
VLLTVGEVREGCVASALTLTYDIVDRWGAAAGVRSFAELESLAATTDADLLLAGESAVEHLLALPALNVRGDSVAVLATLVFVDDAGFPVADPATATGARIAFTAEGALLRANGVLVFRYTIDGLTVDGEVFSDYDGCALAGTLARVTARTFADAPGGGFGSVFTSGNVDLGVETPDGAVVGTAALAGRHALVALELSGLFSTAEITLH